MKHFSRLANAWWARLAKGIHLAVMGAAGAMCLAGCTSYTSLPLDRAPDLALSQSSLAEAPRGALNLHDVDLLILANNPELRAARARLGVAQAQIIEADVLPNPQITLSYPFFAGGVEGVNAFSAGISQDLKSIVMRPTKVEAASNAAAEIHASLFWQEWQTVGKARLLFVDIVSGERAQRLIRRSRNLLEDRFDRASEAIKQGNGTLATLAPDMAAVAEVRKIEDDLERIQLGRRHEVNALLGLAPDTPLILSMRLEPSPLDARLIRQSIESLADRRPDLIALQYGYRSQDASLRQAILAQFPTVTIGVAGGRDTDGSYSVGPSVTFDLPIFDRHEGAIARELATRDALREEFTARLKAAAGEVGALLSDQQLVLRQLSNLEPRLRMAKDVALRSETAYRQNLLDERTYIDTQLAQLTIERQKIELEQASLESRMSLATLTGAGLPKVAIDPEPPTNGLSAIRAPFGERGPF